MELTFYFWLINFSRCLWDSPVGDLARDVLSDDNFPKGSKSYEDIRDYLISQYASQEVLDAFDEAWRGYDKYF